MEYIIAAVALVVGGVIGLIIGRSQLTSQSKRLIEDSKSEAEHILENARNESREIVIAAKDEAIAIRDQAESEISRTRRSLQEDERRLDSRRSKLEARTEKLEQREQRLNKRQSALDKQANEQRKAAEKYLAELERIAMMSQEEAKELLLAKVEEISRKDTARIIRAVEDEAKANADEKARKIIAWSIQRLATDQVAEMVVSVVPLPNEEMKGRIIGRNGRNIRAFEQAAGVDVIVDDTPEAVTISCFDPIRREVARRAMGKLVLDGRIHPAHIEKLLSDSRKDVNRETREAGEKAALDAGIHGLHHEIIKILGRLKFRTSYGQNQLHHVVESAHIAGLLATELGANVQIAKTGALLHDLGKALDHDMEGTHAALGAEICRRYGISPSVIRAIASHHHEVEQETVEDVIVEVADAISGARPGARRESLESYLRRIKALEDVAKSFEGVAESYALQAGREVRIIVKPEEVDDLGAIELSRDVARKVEEMMQYPGQIKVTVIREKRAVDYAK
ncbi:MAG: ribonuclease Y [Chloroflexota bacterium]